MSLWSSLAGQLFKRVFTFYVFLAVFVTIVQLGIEYTSTRKQIEGDLKSLAHSFGPGIADAIWAYDQLQIQTLAQGLAQASIVTGVHVLALDGQTLSQVGEVPEPVDQHTRIALLSSFQSEVLPLSLTTPRGTPKQIGTLELYCDSSVVWRRVADSFVVILVNSVLKTLGLWVIFYWTINKTLSRPLARLTAVVSEAEFTATALEPIMVDHKGEDELARLLRAMHIMQERVLASQNELKSVNSNLELTVEQRTQELRQSEQRQRTIMDHLPMRVSFVDNEERYRFLNNAYERTFGKPRDELYGKTVKEVVGEGVYSQIQDYVRSALNGEEQIFDSEMTTKEGYRCYQALYVPQRSDINGSVLGFVAIITDTTAQRMEERRLTKLSQVDSLTGLLNRAGFEQRLQEACDRCRTTRGLMALIFMDLDNFKPVNDTLGHPVGDLLLRGVAGRLTKCLRTNDAVARQGGDEFAVIVEELSGEQDARVIAASIVRALDPPFVLEGEAVHVTGSLGVTLFHGNDNKSPANLQHEADELLYQAKAAGRNRFCMNVDQDGLHGVVPLEPA